jgi:hypothetical protein
MRHSRCGIVVGDNGEAYLQLFKLGNMTRTMIGKVPSSWRLIPSTDVAYPLPETRKALSAQALQQRAGLLQIKCVEALSEGAVDRGKGVASFSHLARTGAESREAHSGAQLK